MADIVSAWLKQVEDAGGDECPNCTGWRLLRGRELEECSDCGDEAMDIDLIANKMEQLP